LFVKLGKSLFFLDGRRWRRQACKDCLFGGFKPGVALPARTLSSSAQSKLISWTHVKPKVLVKNIELLALQLELEPQLPSLALRTCHELGQ
jgi:hypothetical protein